jgi:N-carbamoylputrescine amidase
VGREAGLQFWGASFVADPNGRVMHRANQEHEELVLVPCDLAQLDAVRTHWPFLRDRRIDAYGEITQRYVAVP